MQWFVYEGVEDDCGLTLDVSLWVEFPLEAACIALLLGIWLDKMLLELGGYFCPCPAHLRSLRPLCFPVLGDVTPLAFKGEIQEPLGPKEDGGEPSFPWFHITTGTKESSRCWKLREFLGEGLSYSALGGYVPFSALALPVLCLTPSPLLPSPRFFFIGCLAPSTFRCQSVLAHCYSPPIPLAQPSFKLLCQGARIPWWRWRLAHQCHRCIPEDEHLCTSCAWREGPGAQRCWGPSLQQHFQICSPASAASLTPALGFPLGSPTQLGVL